MEGSTEASGNGSAPERDAPPGPEGHGRRGLPHYRGTLVERLSADEPSAVPSGGRDVGPARGNPLDVESALELEDSRLGTVSRPAL